MYSSNVEGRNYSQLWTHRGNKFVIGTIHGEAIEIVAQYNPKELSRSVQAEWIDNPNTSAAQSKTSQNKVWAEYGASKPRTVSLELLFDGYEEGISVAPIVEALESLTMPVDMNSRDASKRRPQLCVAVWGTQQLRCVVESVATKLTMFDISGEPLRATCTIQLKEVDVAAMMQADTTSATTRLSKSSGGYQLTPRDHSPYPPEDSKGARLPPLRRTASDTTNAAAGKDVDADKQSSKAGAHPQTKPASPSTARATTSAASAKAPAAAPPTPAAATPARVPATSSTPAADPPIVTNPTVTNSASAPSTVGTPSEKVDPNTIEGKEPGSANVFQSEKGTPSADVNPEVYDNPDAPVFKTVGKPSHDNSEWERDNAPAPQPDAVSSADAQDPDAKRLNEWKKME